LVDTWLHFFSEVRFLIFFSEWNAYGILGHEYTSLSIGGSTPTSTTLTVAGLVSACRITACFLQSQLTEEVVDEVF